MAQGRSESGVTLVELMVVIAVIGFLSAGVVLSLSSARPGLQGDAALFSHHMRLAMRASLLRGESVAVALDDAGYRIALERSGALLGDYRWQAADLARLGDGERIRLDPIGLQSAYVLTLSDGRRSLRLIGGADGTLSMEGWDG